MHKKQPTSVFSPDSLVYKLISLALVWSMCFGSLPLYASDQARRDPATYGKYPQAFEGREAAELPDSAGVSAALGYGRQVAQKAFMPAPADRLTQLARLEPPSAGDRASSARAALRGGGLLGRTPARPLAMFQYPNAAVKPVLECVVNNGGGSYTARFGYQNLNTVVVTIPVGTNNKFTPTPINRGQATVFQPGRQRFVFDVPFNGSNLVWSLKGPDNQNRTATASSNSASCVTNHPPVANAGPAQTVFVGTTVQLDGSGSTDADGDPLTYRWSFVSIPAGSSATLSGSTTVHPTFVVDKPGCYKVQLIVNDGKVDSTPATVLIDTKNSPPVANAGPNQTVQTHVTVQLNGSQSSDVDGDPLTYLWSFVSVPTGSAATLSSTTIVNPTFVTDKKGTYVVQLVVNDGHVNSAPAQVTISDVNSPPVANAGPNQTVTTRTLVTLDGSGSTDVDGDSLTYTWAILSAPSGSTATLSDVHAVKPSFTVDVLGSYVIQLIVNDGTANSAPATVTISDVNSPPVANAGPAQSVALGAIVTLDGTGSSDVDGQTLSYSWSILSKPAGSTATLSQPTSANPFFTADKAGNYVVQLIVNDGIVNSQPATVTISTINSVPVANRGANQTVTTGSTVFLDGSGSSDADGDPLTFTWSILSQPAGGTATLSDSHAVNPTFVANAAGLYVVQLIVNDGKVDSPPKTVTITANTANQPPVVNAGPNLIITLPTNTVTLNGSATDDGQPAGVLNITWSQVSGPAAVIFSSPSAAVTQATFSVAGTFVLRLSANDTQLSSSSDVTVTVLPQPINQPPVVNAGANQTITLPTNTVALNGSATDDGLPSGTLITSWSKFSGPAPVTFSNDSQPVTQATFSAAGTYVLRLTANDTQLTGSADVTVTVNPGVIGDVEVCYWCDQDFGFGKFNDGPTFVIHNTSSTDITNGVLTVGPGGGVSDSYNVGTVPAGGFVAVLPGMSNDGLSHTTFFRFLGFPLDTSDFGPTSIDTQFEFTGLQGPIQVDSDVFTPRATQGLSVDGRIFINFLGGPGDNDQGCNVCFDKIVANLSRTLNSTVPILGITKTHSGAFAPGQQNAAYTITVSNAAKAGPASGVVTVTDVVPSGLTLTSMAGTGWSCVANACTRADGLAPGASYPPISVTVNVAADAPSQVVNRATVSGGGSAGASASDTTVIVTPEVMASCLPSGSLSALVRNGSVTSYVPNGFWGSSTTGIRVVPLEGGGSPSLVATPGVVNSCSSNSVTGQTVCTSNNTDVYLLNGSALTNTLTSGSTGTARFSGGSCQNCGVAINAGTNQAVISVGLAAPSNSGIQVLDLNTNTFSPPVPTSGVTISEDIAVDPTRNLILSASEQSVFEVFVPGSVATQLFDQVMPPRAGSPPTYQMDATAIDCSTGIAMASVENPVNFFTGAVEASFVLADLTQAKFTSGAPGTWTSPVQPQPISELSGREAFAIAPGAHLGVATGEFGDNTFGAFRLPATSGTGTPMILDWVLAHFPNPGEPNGQQTFQSGEEPHTVTAYVSPTTGKAYGVIADNGLGFLQGDTNFLAVIDLQALLDAPRIIGSNHVVDPSVDLVATGILRFVPTRTFLRFPASPNSGPQGAQDLQVAIQGANTHFVQGATTASFGPGITVTSLTVNSPTSLTARLNIDPLADIGPRVVSVTTGPEALSMLSGTFLSGFNVVAGPAALSQLAPTSGAQGQNVTVTITGQSTHFAQGVTTVDFQFGSFSSISNIVVNSPTSLTVTLNISPLEAVGSRFVTVATSGEIVHSSFNITPGAAKLTNLSPSGGPQGMQHLTVNIAGQSTHFTARTSFLNLDGSFQVESFTVNSPTSATAMVDISPNANLGSHTFSVVTVGENAFFAPGFNVTPGVPTLLPLFPSSLPQGAGNTTININGAFTHFAQGASVANFGPGVNIVSLTVSSPTLATVTLNVDPIASLGARNVTVTTGSEVATLINGFTVNPGSAVISLFSPTSLSQGQQNMTVALTGSSTHWAAGVSTAAFGPGISINSLTVNSPTSATAVVSVDPAATGPRPIAVITAGEVALSNNLGISTGTPTLTLLTPPSAQPGTQNLAVAIAGLATHFVQGTSVAGFGPGITVASFTVNSATSATAVLNINPAATLGARNVTVTTGSEVAGFNNGFSVVSAPPTVSLNLAEGAEITAPTPITGSVSGGNWTLAYALASADGTGPAPVFTPFASGSTVVVNDALGTLDPSMLLNGNYIIRLSSTDAFGQTAFVNVNIEVARNLKVGIFTLSFADMSVPAPGLPITVTRTYDSRDKVSHDFGVGWTLSLVNVRLQKNGVLGGGWQMTQTGTVLSAQFCLQETKPHFVTITFPDGRVYKFQASTQPQCQQLAPIEAASLTFVQVPGTTGTQGATLQIFGDASVLVNPPQPGVVDLLDQGTLQDKNPTVFQLTTAEGFTYVIDQALGATSVSDPNGNTLSINANGISSSNGQNVVFTRDAQGRITQIADPAGNSLNYAYSGAGDLGAFTDRAGNTTTFTYDATHLLTNIVAPNGVQAVKNTYDAQGRLVSTTDTAGKTITYTHALAANQEAIQDRLGNTTTYTYDADGNVTQTVDALGNTTSATYDANDNKLTETVCTVAAPGCAPVTTTYTYDQFGNRLTETDPLGNQTSYTYNQFKQPLTITDPLGHATTNTYDTHGNLLTTQDALGNSTTFTNTAQGLPVTVKDTPGNITQFAYDASGNLTQQTDALGNVSNFTYDANHNKLSQAVIRTKSDGTKETLSTKYQYDGNNRLTKTTNPDGTVTQVAYNSIGKPSDTLDALNRNTHFDYDSNGRLTKTTYPDQTFESITYDANDRRLTSTDRAGRVTSYTYDAVGRLTKTTFADNATAQTVYDAAGRTTKITDALGNATSFAYDDAGRRTSVTDALNHVTSITYDAAGNQTAMTDALNHTTQFVYDNSNRRVQTIYPDSTADSVAYDALGRQTSKTDQAGKVTQFGYDAVGRLTSVTQFLNGNPLVTTYAYDEIGNRISQTDANGHTTKFVYDQLGRRASRTLPVGMSESYTYDAAGNLAARTDFNSHTTTYQYDNMNRLTKRTADAFFSQGACAGNGCGATNVTYTYTSTGRRLSMTDASGTTNYTYDTRDRLLTKSAPAGTLSYTYDSSGSTLSLKSSNVGGASMTYAYDALNRLSSVTDASGVTTYSYDAVGNLAGYTYPNGVATSYGYDPLNRLTNMQSTCSTAAPGCGAPGAVQSSYAYTLGAAGNRLSVAELSGRTVNYGYDDLYRLTSETITGTAVQNGNISYTYDAVGNRTQRNSTVPAVPATGLLNYDANDRTSTDPYDANGNLLSSGAGSNVYDFENRLVQAGGVKVVYDGDGSRVQETVAGVTTSYQIADQNLTGYAQVVDELQGGAVSRTYSYGLTLISQKLTANSQGPNFYGFDGHGSVRYLTDSNGAITDTYDYDAFGSLIAQTGSTPNNYLFAGEQFDPALGVYYNRARYYDERSGRFWTMDDFEGLLKDPGSLHKYLFARDNPVDRIDPSGRFDMVESLAVATIANTINNIEAINGQAAMDQIKYGGNAGLKSLFISAVMVLLTPVVISVIGRIVRAAPPLLKAAIPGVVTGVKFLNAEEVAFAEEIVAYRGGRFVGPPYRSFPGIDGTLDGMSISMKQIFESPLVSRVVKVTLDAETKASKAGYADVELFVEAKNVLMHDLLNVPGVLPRLGAITRQGTISAINVLTRNGWLRIVP